MRDLEARYPDTLVGIGVHSGKFIAERSTANIRSACQRLGVDRPVVNDRQFRTWRAYAVRAWPTIALIDPAGRVVFSRAGELTAEMLAPLVDALISEAESNGTLVRGPFELREPQMQSVSGPLCFPGKVLAAGRRLFVSDTGQHRILQVQLAADGLSGEVVRSIGAGVAGYEDGSVHEAQFREPQGLALWGEKLLVADRDNHTVRSIDLEVGAVSTVAGTGELARSRNAPGHLDGEAPQFHEPSGISASGDLLYIADTNSHAIRVVDTGTNLVSTLELST